MTLKEKIENLDNTIKKDELKIKHLREKIKTNKDKRDRLKSQLVQNSISKLSSQGIDIVEVVDLVANKDTDKLLDLIVK